MSRLTRDSINLKEMVKTFRRVFKNKCSTLYRNVVLCTVQCETCSNDNSIDGS